MKRGGWYNLPLNRDERKLIYSKLTQIEWMVSKYAHGLPFLPNEEFAIYCASYGYLELLQWGMSMYIPMERYSFVLYCAAINGHLDVLKYLMIPEYTTGGIARNLINYAIESGDLETVKWCESHFNYTDHLDMILCANRFGHEHIIQWISSIHHSH